MKQFDIVIIGSGVGLSFIGSALNNNMSCVIVEDAKFGGTCLTRGCIPSKVLVYPADVIRQSQHAKKIGLKFSKPEIDLDMIKRRMQSKIDSSIGIEESLDSTKNLTVYKGVGEFTDNYKMKVKLNSGGYSKEFKGTKFVIAAGARTFMPPIDNLENTGYITSESFFSGSFPEKLWSSLLIVGGGAIGTEFAHIFSAYGTKVTVIEMKDRLVSTEEEEISRHLERQFKSNQIDVYLGHKVISVSTENGMKSVTVESVHTGETTIISCEEIFISSGIRSNTDKLKIENTDIKTDARGWIETNEYLETSMKNIWALGDINGKYQFRHKANYETEICINNIFSNKEKLTADYSKVPWAIFTNPQIAHVGMTEVQALTKGRRILVGKNNYSSVSKGFAMGYLKGSSDDGFVKLIVDSNMKILGAHIIGPHAAILIQSFVYLMNAGFTCTMSDYTDHDELSHNKTCIEGGTMDPMYDSMVIHPSLSEVTGWIIGKMEWV